MLRLLAVLPLVASQLLMDDRPVSRIILGRVVDISDYPFQAGILQRRNTKKLIICGGAIVGPKIVFTAAHCTHQTDFRRRTNLSVLVGANGLTDSKGHEHVIERVFRHPDFSYRHFDNDFSILMLEEPIQFNKRVQSIPISTEDYESGSIASVSGWGRTEYGFQSPYLRATKLVLERWGNCQNYFPFGFHPRITRNMLCVKPSTTTTYFGDSGGPLTVNGRLLGLVSFGRTVYINRKTTVFTRVKNFLDFAGEVLPNFNGDFKEIDNEEINEEFFLA